MDYFQSLFGLKREEIKRTVVLLPFLLPNTLPLFGVQKLVRAAVFACANTPDMTIIKTGMGASFAGDAVMYLENSPAENIFLLGTCGLLDKNAGLQKGALTIPDTAYNLESFSDILLERSPAPALSKPDAKLIHKFSEQTGLTAPHSNCVSFGSLYFEEQYRPVFQTLGAHVIEMECAAVFNAARKTGRKAMAILGITDIPGEHPFFMEPGPTDKKSLTASIGQACKAIHIFARQSA